MGRTILLMQTTSELPVYHGPRLATWAKEGQGPSNPVWAVDIEHTTHSQTFWFASSGEAAQFIAVQQAR